ncbi:hypothetical protein H5410_023590 [Solanum commersonii]|uniref:Uncharacterized protein n=1 Tax=Solanum commersonii TaxID=4109 RepID=A0A9J5ZII7_SOLCO|nr:hypothetical protein H5410_023590 [Solanum commersonii]
MDGLSIWAFKNEHLQKRSNVTATNLAEDQTLRLRLFMEIYMTVWTSTNNQQLFCIQHRDPKEIRNKSIIRL